MAKTDEPKVSIGMPVFNAEDYLSGAIQSLLAQTFEDFELIISDNASTDRTFDLCQEYLQIDRRIKYFRNDTNLGGAYNDNRVFSLSSGEYFKWAAHDDLCAPELIAQCVEVLDQDLSVCLCYPKTMIIDENGSTVGPYIDNFNLMSSKPHQRFRQVLGKNQLLNPIYGVIRSAALRKTQMIKKYIASDRVFLGELALKGKFCEIPEYLFYRRVHPKKSTVINKTTEQLTNWFDPDSGGKILIPNTKRFLEFYLSINRSTLSGWEKVLCYREFFAFYLSPATFIGKVDGLLKDVNQATRAISYKVSLKKGNRLG